MKIRLTSLLVASLFAAGGAQAAIINAPVPVNAYINFGGLDWAWASPVAADGSFGNGAIDLSFQGALGWRLPTLAELAAAPTALDFMFPGANVPFGGSDPVSGATFAATNPNLTGDAACAAPYFNNSYSHCDWINGRGQNPPEDWWKSGDPSYYESLVVRDATVVPEPGALALLGLGLIGLVAARKRA
jgi:hypothetical protein